MELGYQYKYLPIPSHPGSRSLLVILNAQPTFDHFDPERTRVPVIVEDKFIATIVINHPWPGDTHYKFTAGIIRLSDRHNKIVDTYSLGGSMNINILSDKTVLKLESTAPLFPKFNSGSISFKISSKMEALLAERKAVWRFNPEIYEERIIKIKPADLYWLLIKELYERATKQEAQQVFAVPLKQFLQQEYDRLSLPGPLSVIPGSLTDHL